MTPHRRGIALCLLSACGFGAMAIFAKQAYAEGVTVLSLLVVRFILAGALFWAIVALRGARLPSRRTTVGGLGLGAVGYAAQAGLYFGALTHIDASLNALLLSTYPALVFAGAVALGRDRATGRRALALGLAAAGTALVLLGAGLGAVDGTGLAMGLGCAAVYAGYILVSDRLIGDADGFVLAALVCTGAAVTLAAVGLAGGSLDLRFSATGWAWIVVLSTGSTVVAIAAFFAGLREVGPSTAAIVSVAEPAVTVALATVVYGDALGLGQLAGGVLVLVAVVVLQRRPGGSVPRDAPAAHAAAAAPARALARSAARG